MSSPVRPQSEYQPWSDVLKKINDIELALCDTSIAINTKNLSTENLEYFYALCLEMYKSLRPMMHLPVREKWDSRRETLKELYSDWKIDVDGGLDEEEAPIELLEFLNKFHEDLLVLKQQMGLGIPMKQQYTFSKKLKMGLLGEGGDES